MAIENLTCGTFDKVIDGNALVEFYATNCAYCKILAPTLEKVVAENPEYRIFQVNVDGERELAEKFNVSSVPTLLKFSDGRAVEKKVGAISKSEVLTMLRD